MDRREALVALNMAADISGRQLHKLLHYFPQPQDIFSSAPDELTSICGVTANTARKLLAIDYSQVRRELDLAEKIGLKIVVLNDPDYPRLLKEIYDPAPVLYVRGNVSVLNNFCFAVVGSRDASFYGVSCAEKFAYELALRGCVIVSGLARGVDTYAHKGALKAKGATIAVMGSGFANIYPPENIQLSSEISEFGAVISEFPISTKPSKYNFPRRNRIISGLSQGVLVAEAGVNSGALITADFALEQGREVFAVPGKIDSPGSFGTNSLIKQGAKLVCSIDDIIVEFDKIFVSSCGYDVLEDQKSKKDIAQTESTLYNLITTQPIAMDEIIEKSAMAPVKIYLGLLKLQMNNAIKALPGKQFVRV